MSDSRRRRILGVASRLVARGRLRERGREAADEVLLEAQKAAYRELHQRFAERAERGERGLTSAMEALDAMWNQVRTLRDSAPFILETLSSERLQPALDAFYDESTGLLEDAIRLVFAEDLGRLALPPERMAVLIRVLLEGLLVELASAQTPEDVERVDQAYADARDLFERFVLSGMVLEAMNVLDDDPIALPW